MTVQMIPFEAEKALDWIDLTDAIAQGHTRPKAEVGDTFLRRGPDTMLNRSAWIDGLGLAVKTCTIFPGNTSVANINGVVTLYDDAQGLLSAILDFHLVTKWKTVADSLLGAVRLARPDSASILIIGAGTVARGLIEAYSAGFPEARISVWNRTASRVDDLRATHPEIAHAEDLATAVKTADIISCATMSSEPVLKGEWLRPGCHVDLIGAYRADMREADDEVLRRGRVFVDSFDTTLDHIGELKDPLARGVLKRSDVIADFYDLDRFTRQPEDITVFKNGGGAHLDLMVSDYIRRVWTHAP